MTTRAKVCECDNQAERTLSADTRWAAAQCQCQCQCSARQVLFRLLFCCRCRCAASLFRVLRSEPYFFRSGLGCAARPCEMHLPHSATLAKSSSASSILRRKVRDSALPTQHKAFIAKCFRSSGQHYTSAPRLVIDANYKAFSQKRGIIHETTPCLVRELLFLTEVSRASLQRCCIAAPGNGSRAAQTFWVYDSLDQAKTSGLATAILSKQVLELLHT